MFAATVLLYSDMQFGAKLVNFVHPHIKQLLHFILSPSLSHSSISIFFKHTHANKNIYTHMHTQAHTQTHTGKHTHSHTYHTLLHKQTLLNRYTYTCIGLLNTLLDTLCIIILFLLFLLQMLGWCSAFL